MEIMKVADEDESDEIDFNEFVQVIVNQKVIKVHTADDADTIDAFVAMGGNSDKSGQVDMIKLTRTMKIFGITIDPDKLLLEADKDESGFIDYEEFKTLMLGEQDVIGQTEVEKLEQAHSSRRSALEANWQPMKPRDSRAKHREARYSSYREPDLPSKGHFASKKNVSAA